jgi:hypothetical protein
MSLDSYIEGLTKQAERNKVEQVYLKTASIEELKAMLGMDKSAEDVNPGWLESQKGMYRARRASDKGLGKLVASRDLIKDRYKGYAKGSIAGGAGGAGLGALVGLLAKNSKNKAQLGAALGGLSGVILGGAAGTTMAEMKYLKDRGVNPKLLGLGSATFTPEAAEKYLPKKASLEVGDAAGRILAKMAAIGQPKLTPEEVQEAIQSAQAREDIPGRATRWGRAGGALGMGVGAGIGGGLGHAVSKALGARSGLAGAVAGGLGLGAAGGLLGSRIGRAEGAEEAAADRLVSLLRARKNMQRGAGLGYMAAQQQMGANPFPAGR